MRSFKVKLVAYFVLLSLLPLAAAFWGFSTVAARSETRRVDARLQAGLRATLAAYQEELRHADANAIALARSPRFERALLARDRKGIELLLRGRPNLAVASPGFHVGRHPSGSAARELAVVGPGGSRAQVIASVPLDASLVGRLRARSGLDRTDRVFLLVHGRVVGAGPLNGRLHAPSGRPATRSVAGRRYRVLLAGTLEEQPIATLGVLSPQAEIDAANSSAERRLLLGLAASLLLVALVAYFEGRMIVRAIGRLVDAARAIARGELDQRVPVQGGDELALLGRTFNQMASQLQLRLDELEAERGRLRDVISSFGEALAATHDVDQLLRVIVETAVEATGAAGGIFVGQSGELVRSGYPDKGSGRIEVPLSAGQIGFGSLMLFGDDFEDDDRMTAVSLAAHAVVALENARLHKIVESQALVDGLTGLANRRHCEEALVAELARLERFEGSLAVVLADLDGFKGVNDRYGHPAGDTVLREFAEVLRESLRDIDLGGRWGGEEFLLLLPGTDLAGAARVAGRIRRALEGRALLSVEGERIAVTASFGVASYLQAATGRELVEAADAALYEAKRAGKNRVETAPEPVGRP